MENKEVKDFLNEVGSERITERLVRRGVEAVLDDFYEWMKDKGYVETVLRIGAGQGDVGVQVLASAIDAEFNGKMTMDEHLLVRNPHNNIKVYRDPCTNHIVLQTNNYKEGGE